MDNLSLIVYFLIFCGFSIITSWHTVASRYSDNRMVVHVRTCMYAVIHPF